VSDAAAAALQARIQEGIPLSQAMGCRIAELGSTHVLVEAPLAPNLNVHRTAFAGSIYALGTLCAWALGSHLVDRAGLNAVVVIAEAVIRYRAPIKGAIRCRCTVSPDRAGVFVADLRTAGRTRLELDVEIGGHRAAVLHSTLHVSLAAKDSDRS
jgi:thioesterase domain-containing protein